VSTERVANKVAEITIYFWVMKIFATGDLLTKPAESGGLGFGTIISSVVVAALFVTFIVYTSRGGGGGRHHHHSYSKA